MSLLNGPVRIALVEPSDADARWFEMALSKINVTCEVMRYTTCLTALEALSNQAIPALIDLIGINWALPMLSLHDFISRLRSMPGFERTPVAVFVEEDHEVEEAGKLGAVACLTKPVNAVQLQRVVEAVYTAKGS